MSLATGRVATDGLERVIRGATLAVLATALLILSLPEPLVLQTLQPVPPEVKPPSLVPGRPNQERFLEEEPQIMFVNTATGVGIEAFPTMRWLRLDLSEYVSPETQWVWVHAQLIITDPAAGNSNTTLALRPVGSDRPCGAYQFQAATSDAPAGEREQSVHPVRLRDRAIEVCWTLRPTGAYYGINLHLVGPR